MPSPFITHDLPVNSAVVFANAGGDVTVGSARWFRANGAGSVILRYPNDGADVTLTAIAGEYIPICPGTIIRSATIAGHIMGI